MFLYLAISIFLLSMLGVFLKKDLISMLVCIELMNASVAILFVLFSKINSNPDGQVFVLFIFIVAAVEIAVGLSLIVNYYKKHKTIYTENL
jgi:NADH-quinone oxidoreductase subunit K